MDEMTIDELDGLLDEVREKADRAWKLAAAEAIRQLVAAGDPFTADEVWAMIEPLGVRTHEPNAMGAVFNAAARDGLITSDGMYRPSCRRKAHRRMVRVWRGAR
jgi:hypothetical protein